MQDINEMLEDELSTLVHSELDRAGIDAVNLGYVSGLDSISTIFGVMRFAGGMTAHFERSARAWHLIPGAPVDQSIVDEINDELPSVIVIKSRHLVIKTDRGLKMLAKLLRKGYGDTVPTSARKAREDLEDLLTLERRKAVAKSFEVPTGWTTGSLFRHRNDSIDDREGADGTLLGDCVFVDADGAWMGSLRWFPNADHPTAYAVKRLPAMAAPQHWRRFVKVGQLPVLSPEEFADSEEL